MAANETETPAVDGKKKRKASGPRQAKPIFLMVSYTDENGASVKLDKSRLRVEAVKDPATLVELVTSGAQGDVTVVTIKPTASAQA